MKKKSIRFQMITFFFIMKLQGREEPVRIRKCYQSMQHTSGEIVSIRDCVILQSDGDGKIPYVAKVSALWENLNGMLAFVLSVNVLF